MAAASSTHSWTCSATAEVAAAAEQQQLAACGGAAGVKQTAAGSIAATAARGLRACRCAAPGFSAVVCLFAPHAVRRLCDVVTKRRVMSYFT
jgi:hypothetical protein